MAGEKIRSEIRQSRTILERIDRELAGHIRREHGRDMRSADKEGRLQGRLDRIEHSLAALSALVEKLDAKIEGRSASARS